jgi:hypothetical protein
LFYILKINTITNYSRQKILLKNTQKKKKPPKK